MNQRSNRDTAIAFLNLVVSGNVREAYEEHVSEGFKHHNPFFKGDRETLLSAMEDDAIRNPNKKLEINLTLEDGNLVTTYSHLQMIPGKQGMAVVHIFRFEDNQIVELWDIGYAIAEDSPNENGMF